MKTFGAFINEESEGEPDAIILKPTHICKKQFCNTVLSINIKIGEFINADYNSSRPESSIYRINVIDSDLQFWLSDIKLEEHFRKITPHDLTGKKFGV